MAPEHLYKWVTQLPSCALGCQRYRLVEASQVPVNITHLLTVLIIIPWLVAAYLMSYLKAATSYQWSMKIAVFCSLQITHRTNEAFFVQLRS
jgi:uncharacterized membrane protein YhdT